MARGIFTDQDVRELPAYGIAEAAGYLRLPVSTLRSWLLGQNYRVGDSPKFFKPVIEIADRKERHLSFINLVEAFVLAGIRRQHEIPLPKVRKAFVEKMGSLIGATQEGQIQMRDIIRDRLERVRRDPKGVPQKIVLFPARSDRKGSADVVIDPRLSFGRPVLDRLGVRTSILAERFDAGDSIEVLAREYEAPPEAIQNAIRCERRAA